MRIFQKAGVTVAALSVALVTLTACGSEESTTSEAPTTTVTRTRSSSVKPSNTAEADSRETQDVDTQEPRSDVPTVTIGSETASEVTTITVNGTPVTSTAHSRRSAEPSSVTTPSSRRGNQGSQEDRDQASSEQPSREQDTQAAGESMVPTTLSATTVVNSNQESYTFTNPTCDGHYIVVVGNYVPSGSFDGAELDQVRAQYPGAMVAESGACGSLAGESYPIYFDYGWDGASACAQTIPGARPKVAGPEGSPNPCES